MTIRPIARRAGGSRSRSSAQVNDSTDYGYLSRRREDGAEPECVHMKSLWRTDHFPGPGPYAAAAAFGDVLHQPELAQTYRDLARDGVGAFYTGAISRSGGEVICAPSCIFSE